MEENLVRPDIKGNPKPAEEIGCVAKPLSNWERLFNTAWFCKTVLLVLVLGGWEWYAVFLDNALMFPTFSATVKALGNLIMSGEMFVKAGYTLKILGIGYMAGLALATLITVLATFNRFGQYVMELLTSIVAPLPAVALLPLAFIWFGLGNGSLLFVLIISVWCPIAQAMHSGFKSVPTTLRMVGRNYELKGFRYAQKILFPAAFPAILTGAKIGWAFGWRTLIAAELVAGVSSGKGGIGWMVNEAKQNLDIPVVFAGLVSVIVIGLIVENFIFKPIENRTVKKWGMQS